MIRSLAKLGREHQMERRDFYVNYHMFSTLRDTQKTVLLLSGVQNNVFDSTRDRMGRNLQAISLHVLYSIRAR